jgi:hypothetical protein
LFSLLGTYNIQAQSKFNKLYDNKNQEDRANAIIQTKDGNFVVTGVTAGADAWYIIKLNTKGDTIWTYLNDLLKGKYANYGEFSYSLVEIENGDLVVSGFDADTVELKSNTLLLKLNKRGQYLWAKTVDNSMLGLTNRAYQIKETNDKGFIYVGWEYQDKAASTSQALLVKTDSLGIIQWKKEYGGSGYEFTPSFDKTQNGGYILGGYSYSYSTVYGMYLVKTDGLGVLQWYKIYGDNIGSYGNYVITTKDGGYAIVGAKYKSNTARNAYIVKTDKNGIVEWEKEFAGQYDFIEFTNVQQLPSGDIVASGHYQSNADATKVSGWLVKMNGTNGNTIWEKSYIQSAADSAQHYVFGMDKCADGGFVMAGMARNLGTKPPTSNDFWVVKTDSLGCDSVSCTFVTGISTLAVKKQGFSLYPNPNNGEMHFDYTMADNVTGVFELSDITGRLMAKYTLNNGDNTLNINENLNNGVYLYSVKINNTEVLKEKIVIVH